MMTYSKHLFKTPQREPARSDQVQNNAGGYVFHVDPWQRLDRFLILGAEGGTYYVGERKLAVDNAFAILDLIEQDGPRVVSRIVEISDSGRAVKNTPALFALALCVAYGNVSTRRLAAEALPSVARTGTHLFDFLNEVQTLRGWGRVLKNGVAGWYLSQPVDRLAYQVVKYRQRNGWTHRDVLRKSHAKPLTEEQDVLFRWITSGDLDDALLDIPAIRGFLLVQQAESEKAAAQIVREYNLPRETVPTRFLNAKEVWEALLPHMPITALIRNLGNLSKTGVLVEGAWDTISFVTDTITDIKRLRGGRVHPLNVLSALKTYARGHGQRGKGTWKPVPDVVDALDTAFYKAFDVVEPTNKRYLLGLDISASMTYYNVSMGMSCMEAATVMAMVTYRIEPKTAVMGFDQEFRALPFNKRDRLDTILKNMPEYNGGTDCALPMLYAMERGLDVDVFVVYTDNETWFGDIHPFEALKQYRKATGIPAKLAVVGMTSTEFSIADPTDLGMLDLVGFDTTTPAALAEFARL